MLVEGQNTMGERLRPMAAIRQALRGGEETLSQGHASGNNGGVRGERAAGFDDKEAGAQGADGRGETVLVQLPAVYNGECCRSGFAAGVVFWLSQWYWVGGVSKTISATARFVRGR